MNRRILLALNDPIERDACYLALQRSGWGVILSMDAETLIAQIEEFKPDILVIDAVLPGISGIELTREIRKKFDKRPWIILTSMLGFNEMVMQVRDAGANSFLIKPFAMESLVKKVNDMQNEYLSA